MFKLQSLFESNWCIFFVFSQVVKNIGRLDILYTYSISEVNTQVCTHIVQDKTTVCQGRLKIFVIAKKVKFLSYLELCPRRGLIKI